MSENDAFAGEPTTKKEQIIALYESGTTDIAEIVRKVKARPSYVAQVLQASGFYDMYETQSNAKNVYSRYFRNVLRFDTEENARESVQRIDRLYNYFERLGDQAGQHQSTVLALTGKNRARWAGNLEISQIFHDWLVTH